MTRNLDLWDVGLCRGCGVPQYEYKSSRTSKGEFRALCAKCRSNRRDLRLREVLIAKMCKVPLSKAAHEYAKKAEHRFCWCFVRVPSGDRMKLYFSYDGTKVIWTHLVEKGGVVVNRFLLWDTSFTIGDEDLQVLKRVGDLCSGKIKS